LTHRADVAIVGAGILGLAHATLFARAGKRVVVFERHPQARGASVRNFGMLWPVGQPAGLPHLTALRSRQLWLETLTAARLPFFDRGSLHVAYHDDEWDLLREFAELGPAAGYDCRLLGREDTLRLSPVQPAGLRGGLFSPVDLNVDPWAVVADLPRFLAARHGVAFRFAQAVTAIRLPFVETGLERWQVDEAIVCGGDDFETLFPAVFQDSGITRIKLQMMRTPPQPGGWSLGPALGAGLTLRFYQSFRLCPSFGRLRDRIAAELPEYDRWGIHVLVSQTQQGAVTIGDSHESGLAVDPFEKSHIDDLVLRYLESFLPLPDARIAQRWHGVYAKHPHQPWFEAAPEPGVRIVTAPGGSGMTLSFGIAERTLQGLTL
jgi:FAD dependent oxidoreductase TIGR03364